jgi:TonB family protein
VKTIEVNFKAPERNFNQGEIAKGQTFNQGNALRMNKVVMIDFPVWTSAPSFDDLARAYPAKAGSEEGYSVVQCHVHSDGVLSGCGVIKEAPEKHDFGKAALALAPHFRIEPRLAQGHGGTPLVVNIPMRFPPREEIAQRTVMAPAWINGFDQKQVPKLFPPEAAASGLTTGRGVARCTVAADGRLTDCAPEPGAPDGLGFSEAAVKLASAMKMNLWSADAEPVEGGVIHIPIRLNLKPDVKAQ